MNLELYTLHGNARHDMARHGNACALILKVFDIYLPLRSHGVQKTKGCLLKYFVTARTGGIQFNTASSEVAFLKVLGNPEQ